MAANNLKDEGIRMVRQASDEGKNAALKVRAHHITTQGLNLGTTTHSPFQLLKHPQVDTASQVAREAWQELLRNLSRCKIKLAKLTDQAFLADQLQMIFKDESKED